jgi:hypothetical protein
MGPWEVSLIIGGIWLVLTVIVVRRFGWLLGLILGFSLVPMASGAIFYAVLVLSSTTAALCTPADLRRAVTPPGSSSKPFTRDRVTELAIYPDRLG